MKRAFASFGWLIVDVLCSLHAFTGDCGLVPLWVSPLGSRVTVILILPKSFPLT